MFYSRELLGRRGRLATLWLAGHLKKVSKPAVLAANISALCAMVENPEVPLALPVQSTLLRGVVFIESKKSIYLLERAIEAKTAAAEIDRMRTTGDVARIKARSDLITLAGSAALPFDQLAPFALEGEARGFESTQDRLAIDLSVQAALYARRSTLSTARAEDITLSGWSLESQIASDSFELALAQDELTGGVFDLDEPGVSVARVGAEGWEPEMMEVEPLPPITKAASELTAVLVPEERERRQRKKRVPGVFQLQIDENLELSDATIRAALSDTHAIVYYRPGMALPIVAEFSIKDIITRPAGVDPRDETILPEFFAAFESQRKEPVHMEPTTEEARGALGGLVFEPEEPWISDISIEAQSLAELERAIAAPESDLMEIEPPPSAAELESALSMRSFLGHPLDASAIESERSAHESLEAEELALRRESGFGVSASFLTPVTGVPPSQFALPHVVHATPPRGVRVIHGLSPITSMFLHEVDAKMAELEAMGLEPRVEFDELLEEVVGSMHIVRRDRALSFFSLLLLQSAGILDCEQSATNAPIWLTKGINYDRRESTRASESF